MNYKDIFDVSVNSGIDSILFETDNTSLIYSQFIGALTLWSIISIFIWEKYIRIWLDSKKISYKKLRKPKKVIRESTIIMIIGCVLTFTLYTLI